MFVDVFVEQIYIYVFSHLLPPPQTSTTIFDNSRFFNIFFIQSIESLSLPPPLHPPPTTSPYITTELNVHYNNLSIYSIYKYTYQIFALQYLRTFKLFAYFRRKNAAFYKTIMVGLDSVER